MRIRPFTRTTEASFPENEALPKKGEEDKQFDKRFREWWDDVKDNLARLDDQMSKFITTDLMEVIDINKQSADIGLSLASKDTEEKFSSVGALDGTLGSHISAINNPHAVTAEQLNLHALAKSGSWDDLKDVPTEFTPADHNQAWSTITSKPTTFPPSTHSHAWDTITSKPTAFPPSTHSHAISDITELTSTLGNKSDTGHSHAYNTLTDVPDLFAPSAHNHAISDITDLSTSLDGKASKVSLGNYATKVSLGNIVPGNATTSTDGLMSSGDKTKLDAMSTGVGSGTVVNAPVRNGNLSGTTSKYPMTSSQPGYITVGYEVPSGVSKIVFLGAGGPGSDSGVGSAPSSAPGYIGGTIPQNTGDFGPNNPINYLGNDQNFMVVWGMPPNNNVGAFDDKVYTFAVQPANGSIVWSSITLLLI